MRQLLYRTLIIAWAMWFGGIVALLIFVQRLFQHDRELAIAAAPQLFGAFESYQLVLAGIAVATAIALWCIARSGWAMIFLVMAIAATVLAIVSIASITPEIMRMRASGETHGPAFSRIHGISMLLYAAESLSLLVAGLAIAGVRLDRGRMVPTIDR